MTRADEAYKEGIKKLAAQQRLEMAAPDLLKALKALVAEIRSPRYGAGITSYTPLKAADAAIAKAEGTP